MANNTGIVGKAKAGDIRESNWGYQEIFIPGKGWLALTPQGRLYPNS